jgi:hypothetical protein
MAYKNFKFDERHCARHLGQPLMNVFDEVSTQEIGEIIKSDHRRCRDQGRRDHLRQGGLLRRRRSHHARGHEPGVCTSSSRRRARKPRTRCCSRRAARCRCRSARSRPAASRGSLRSTALPRRRFRDHAGLPLPRRGREPEDPRSACPRSRSACSPAPAAPSACRARAAGGCAADAAQGRGRSRTRAKALNLLHAVVPADRPDQGRQGLDQGPAARPSRRGTRRASSCPAAPSSPRCRHADLAGRQRDLSPRDLRQLSGRARHPELRL